jgi:Purine-nucleoside phosphorylase
LVDDLDTGDINIPKFVLPWEELSSEYVNAFEFLPVGNNILIDELTKKAEIYARSYGLKVKNDNHATVELFYGETLELLKFFKQMSVSTIDMELSALYRLAAAFGKKAAGILEVGDRPLHKEEFFSQKHKNKKDRRDRSKEVVFKIIASLLQN